MHMYVCMYINIQVTIKFFLCCYVFHVMYSRALVVLLIINIQVA